MRDPLYPPIDPYRTGRLAVDDLHTLYYEESGRADGAPVLFLHGGPGAGATAKDRRFFDPSHYRIVIVDQRGSGRSRPLGELRSNTTELLVADIETLRRELGIERWHVFGGSWGSTLSLYYAQCHPDRCTSLTLRGIFLMRQSELDWWLHGMGRFFPELHRAFVEFLPESERGDLLEGYWRRLTSEDPEIQLAAARSWSLYEGSCCTLLPDPELTAAFAEEDMALGLARLEAHYFRNQRFEPETLLLDQIERIRHIPSTVVQGRYDIVCPIESADDLHRAWPEANYVVVPDAGHASREPGTARALVATTDALRSL